MRRFIIDTDTASDDAVALVMALRAQNIHVEAITCVHGNVPLQVASRNARISVQKAATYQPPVYQGLAIPLLRVLEHRAESAHGADGLGNMNYPEPDVPLADGNAVQKIVDIVAADDSGELELCAIGPMTNIAAAILLAPQVMKKVKNLTVMGGQWRMIDAFTPNAEFNIALDAEAVKIVLDSGVKVRIVPLNATHSAILTLEDADGWLHATVVDHGCGFDVEHPEVKGSGCGLSGMRERARLIGATLTMASDGDGTVVTLVAPMKIAEGGAA